MILPTPKSHETFMSEIEIINPNINILSRYVGAREKIKCECKIDGYVWDVTPDDLLHNRGCPKCAKNIVTVEDMLDRIMTNAPFIEPLEPIKPKFTYPLLCKCKICGYIWRLSDSYLYFKRDRCPACNNKQHMYGVNSLKDTHPDVADLLMDKSIAKDISFGSSRKVSFICPNCGNEIISTVKDVCKNGLSCRRCGDGISYPNKFIYSFLKQSGIEFESEKTFDWSKNRRYDFYIPSFNLIIEVHGGQHYGVPHFANKMRNEVENDIIKNHLAMDNNIDNYIVIDARESSRDYIENSIRSSDLYSFIGLDIIDFKLCDMYASGSRLIECCKLYNMGHGNKEIAKSLSTDTTTVWKYINRGIDIGLIRERHSVGLKVYCIEYNRQYRTVREAAKDLSISNKAIVDCCEGKRDYMKRQKTGEILHWSYA